MTDKLITEDKSFPGVLECVYKHKVESTSVVMKYVGPKIRPEDWHAVMEFFRWTYDTTKSESQARMFLDPVDNLLRFWAFPQEAKTGMTAREIDNEDRNRQRAALPNAAKLIPFGTLHHHCDAPAFQSATDYNDEKNQTGLHITIGKMAQQRHDIHARFYHAGHHLEPDLSQFWPLDQEITEMVPAEMYDRVARFQMTNKVVVEFPDEWAKNLIEIKTTHRYDGGTGYVSGCVGSSYQQEPKNKAFWIRKEESAVETICDWLELDMDLTEIRALAQFIAHRACFARLATNCRIWDLGMDEICKEVLDVMNSTEKLKAKILPKGWTLTGELKKMSKKEKKQKMLELQSSMTSTQETAAPPSNNGQEGKKEEGAQKATATAKSSGQRCRYDHQLGCWLDEGGNPVATEEVWD